MTGPKRSKIQIANDHRDIAAMYLRGKTQAEIAEYISTDPARGYTLTVQQISYDLRAIRKVWLASAMRDFDEARAQELAKIDQLELTYWQAWADSRAARETTVIEGTPETPQKRKKTRQDQHGNPQFLAGVQWCIERRCKLLGFDAPQKSEVTGANGTPLYPLADIVRELREAERGRD